MKNLHVKARCLSVILILSLVINGIQVGRERKYYRDVENYINSSAIVEYIGYNREESDEVYFWLDEPTGIYQGKTFYLCGESSRLVLERGLFDKIRVGDTVTFSSAPRYFANGWQMPIVRLATERGEELLSFEEGYQNLMEEYR